MTLPFALYENRKSNGSVQNCLLYAADTVKIQKITAKAVLPIRNKDGICAVKYIIILMKEMKENMKIKSFIAALLSGVMLLQGSALASILGSDVVSWKTQLGDDTYLNKNVFMSEQSGVGQQTEYYCEYTPNENVRPVLVNGDKIFGKRTILQAADYMKENDMQPMIGINADFFSTKTGIPMGHTVIDGKIVTKDATGQDAVGFKKDGSAFISWLEISTVLTTETDSFYIDNINKYRQPNAVPAFLLTDDFGDNTQASTWGIDVVLGDIEGELKIGESLTATIESIAYNEGAIPIPDGKMVLTMDCNGWEEVYLKMQNLKVGEKVTITNNLVYNDERWLEAESAMGTVGGKLIENGVVNSKLDSSAAPRTAIGVKADGNVIFYVLDGRQKGYSYGAKLSTIAKRMAEIGCVDAVNLDGGGSTSIAGIYPGSDTMSVINSPSDGSLRRVANFIFLQNMKKPDGKAKQLYLYPQEKYYMNGIVEKIDTKAVDSGFYSAELPKNISYKITHTDSEITQDGTVTFKGDGEVIIEAVSTADLIEDKTEDISEEVPQEKETETVYGYASVYTYKTPTDIVVRREDTQETVSEITVDMQQQIDFTAMSYAGYNAMKSQDNLFEWKTEGGIGTIDENGLFTAAQAPGAEGRILVTAGEKTVAVNVNIFDVDAVEKYPVITIEHDEEKKNIAVNVSSLGSEMNAENVQIRVDGEYVDESMIVRSQTDKYTAVAVYRLPDDFMLAQHKVRVDARNANGMLAIAADTFGKGVPNSGFEDIGNHWAKNVISYMSNKNIVNGIKEHEKLYFKPNDKITRSQLAVIMCNYLGLDYSQYEGKKTAFIDDAKIPEWARAQITAVAQAGILSGRDKDGELCFDPNEAVTRAEMVTVMGRILSDDLYLAELDDIADGKQIPEWSKDGFSKMIGSGFIKGYEDNTIRPLGDITRAETLQILYNIM